MDIIFYRHSLLSRGGDKMVLAHANYLAEQGHDVTIYAKYVDTVFPINSRLKIKSSGMGTKIGTLLTAVTTRFDADVVIADIIPLACLLFLRNSRKVLYFAQDYDESYYSNFLQRMFIRLQYFLGLTLFRIKTVAVSHCLGDLLKKRFCAKVSVVTNGVDTKVFYPDPSSALIALKGERKTIIVFSRSDSRKGFDVAQQVLNVLISENNESYTVWIVGEPCEAFSARFSSHHFGYVGEEKLRKIFSSADLFLYPSRHEGFPLMALETLACGCPLITTEAVNVVTNGVEALVSPIEDVSSLKADLERLINDQELSNKLINAGFIFVQKNTLQVSKENFETEIIRLFS